MQIMEAAKALNGWINAYASPLHPIAMVGVGRPPGQLDTDLDRIIVYMDVSKREWRSPTPDRYDGWPVEWNWNVGRPIAL